MRSRKVRRGSLLVRRDSGLEAEDASIAPELWTALVAALGDIDGKSLSVPRLLAEMEGTAAWRTLGEAQRMAARALAQLAISSFFEAENVLAKADGALKAKGAKSGGGKRAEHARQLAAESAKLLALREARLVVLNDEARVAARADAKHRARRHAEAAAAALEEQEREHAEELAALRAMSASALKHEVSAKRALAMRGASSDIRAVVREEAASLARVATAELRMLRAALAQQQAGGELRGVVLTSAWHQRELTRLEAALVSDEIAALDRAEECAAANAAHYASEPAATARLDAAMERAARKGEEEERTAVEVATRNAMRRAPSSSSSSSSSSSRGRGRDRGRGGPDDEKDEDDAPPHAVRLAANQAARRETADMIRRDAEEEHAADVEDAVRAAEKAAAGRVDAALEDASSLLRSVARCRAAQRLRAAESATTRRSPAPTAEEGVRSVLLPRTISTPLDDAREAVERAAALAERFAIKRFALDEARQSLDMDIDGGGNNEHSKQCSLHDEMHAWHAWLMSGGAAAAVKLLEEEEDAQTRK